MSGHSKWHSIKHKKAITDARRGKAFTQVANLVSVAARQGGGDPEMNFKLRLAIAKAKSVNMPTANIERAIKRGTGELGGARIEEVTYEAMLPGGAALIIEAATDNRNRTAPEIRTLVTKHGGRMADPGSVMYQFDHKGVIRLQPKDVEAATLDAIEAGAEDVVEDAEEGEGELTVYTKPTALSAVQKKLSELGHEAESAELAYIPKTPVMISDQKTATQIMKIMDILEDYEDVTGAHANFDLSPELAEQLS
ncbi:MAG TPA: YebC/PmpR family DNA-binding transcriptional regulator [Candidatus Dormibacteraeota bacterium]|nr:YebC/PmpR family DNA-binding transcriptional regulator [Candidatus Dormibacteraeota bacterium]